MNRGAIDHDLSMKPLMALAIKEAVKLALIDSVVVPDSNGPFEFNDGRRYRMATEEERVAWTWDIYAMPDECLSTMDAQALAGNVANRLMGTGGWTVSGVYAGNATPQEILDACIYRPEEDPLGDVKLWLTDAGARPDDDEGAAP